MRIRPSRLTWRKSRFSGNNGSCVEVASLPNGGVACRDIRGKVVRYNAYEWSCFLQGVKAGEFDPKTLT